MYKRQILFVTVHPSYLLRIRPDGGIDVEEEHRRFEADLKEIRAYADRLDTGRGRKAG